LGFFGNHSNKGIKGMHNQADRLKFGRTTALAGLFWLSAVGSAAAAEPCGDTSCPKGYACEEVAAACPAIACAPGSECPPCDATVLACVPEPCSSDADCETDMVCLKQTQQECSGEAAPACPPGATCDLPAPAPADCNTVESSQCVPRWSLPCATAASCGDGFSCVERESCSCSGSDGGGSSGSGGASGGGSTPPSRPGTEPAPPSDPGNSGSDDDKAPEPAEVPPSDPATPLPPDCVCEPSGEKACVLNEVACDADSDCPSGWTCGDNPDGVCWASSDGSTGCEPGDPPKLCLPPYTNLGGGGYPTRGEDSGGSGSPTTPDEPSSPGSGTPTSGPTPNPLPPGIDEEKGEDASSGDAESGRGCSVAAGPTPGSGAPGLAALGALVALVLGRSVRTRRSAR
jgi:MYXO-CTERM domain-containing protein